MDTLVYTSAQWRSTSLLNKIIQAGVLCAEIENDYKVKLKIGNGKDRWVDLPYIPELSGYYTKEEIDSFNVVINNKISELEADKHTHDNKEILDKITKEFTIEDKEKLDSITPYDDKEVNKRLTNLEKDSHTHKNKSLLDKTTAVFTTEYEYIITHMETYDVFVGATATKPGTEGLVPAPKAGDNEKFLRGDGNWVTVEGGGTYVLPPATRSTLGGVKVGNNINVDANGVISVTFPPIPEPPEPYVLPIASASTLGGIKVGDGLSIDGTGTLSATGIGTIPPATTTTIGGSSWTGKSSISQADSTMYYINFRDGFVEICGKVKISANPGVASVRITTIAAAYRPSNIMRFGSVYTSGNVILTGASISITTAGVIDLVGTSPSTFTKDSTYYFYLRFVK